MSKFFKLVAAVLIGLFSLTSLTACAQPIDMTNIAMVLDVRTAEEYKAGFVQGAVNLDVQAPEFDQLLDSLAKDKNYVVYCRSGNRAAQAIDRMKAAGFTGELTNLGSLADASSKTGLPVVVQ